MKSYKRIFILLSAALLFTCLLSPWIAALWDLIVAPWPANSPVFALAIS